MYSSPRSSPFISPLSPSPGDTPRKRFATFSPSSPSPRSSPLSIMEPPDSPYHKSFRRATLPWNESLQGGSIVSSSSPQQGGIMRATTAATAAGGGSSPGMKSLSSSFPSPAKEFQFPQGPYPTHHSPPQSLPSINLTRTVPHPPPSSVHVRPVKQIITSSASRKRPAPRGPSAMFDSSQPPSSPSPALARQQTMEEEDRELITYLESHPFPADLGFMPIEACPVGGGNGKGRGSLSPSPVPFGGSSSSSTGSMYKEPPQSPQITKPAASRPIRRVDGPIRLSPVQAASPPPPLPASPLGRPSPTEFRTISSRSFVSSPFEVVKRADGSLGTFSFREINERIKSPSLTSNKSATTTNNKEQHLRQQQERRRETLSPASMVLFNKPPKMTNELINQQQRQQQQSPSFQHRLRQQEQPQQQDHQFAPLPPSIQSTFGAHPVVNNSNSDVALLQEAAAEEGMMVDEVEDGLSTSTVEVLMSAFSTDNMANMDQNAMMMMDNSFEPTPASCGVVAAAPTKTAEHSAFSPDCLFAD